MTHTTAVRNALADLVVDRLDQGTGAAHGHLEILGADYGVLATLDLSNPAFGAATGGVATANAIASALASATGIATMFRLRDRDDVLVLSGTVTATGGGGEVTLSSTSVFAGDTVNVTAAQYTAPA